VASLAYINLSHPKELMDEVWVNFGAPDDKVSIWKVLSKLPAPRAGVHADTQLCNLIDSPILHVLRIRKRD
jgi:hypothetical protein